ncbi:hypothetical protein IJ380_02590 [Candidatus Saccharibacteria bacterium]|nr:hypothetical protein [Candidatus Saccharibacteria bacterium]
MQSLPLKRPKAALNLIGTHQKLIRLSRRLVGKKLPEGIYFPSAKEIIYFEGMRGPDGLKRKCPEEKQPEHFLIPGADNGLLWGQIEDCQANLKRALEEGNHERAAFEAAWMSHFIIDGLTPAHHYPLDDIKEEFMSESEYLEIFGKPLARKIEGETFRETVGKNIVYYGPGGHLTKHFAFEFQIAKIVNTRKKKTLTPALPYSLGDIKKLDFKKEFYGSVEKIADLKMYERYKVEGWSSDLALEAKEILLPEIVKNVTIGWLKCV